MSRCTHTYKNACTNTCIHTYCTCTKHTQTLTHAHKLKHVHTYLCKYIHTHTGTQIYTLEDIYSNSLTLSHAQIPPQPIDTHIPEDKYREENNEMK